MGINEKPNADAGGGIGFSFCLCGKHKSKEQVICFSCFCHLPLHVKYGLASLNFDKREVGANAALDNVRGFLEAAGRGQQEPEPGLFTL
jgi:hypothetical protein